MSYFVDGYTVPDDVNNAEDVKRYQRALGVVVDGIWGRKTQAAYDKSKQEGSPTAQNSSSLLGISNWDELSNRIKAYFEEYLRPSVNNAIKAREAAAKTNMAELDADAAARGMGSSTFVSSLKSRENKNAQSDITALESDYSAALAKELYEAMTELNKQYLEQARFEAQMDLENRKLKAQYNSRYSGNNGSSGSGDGSLSYDECYEYLEMLGEDRVNFFYSTADYWQSCRDEMRRALGDEGYRRLEELFKKTSTPTEGGEGVNEEMIT